MKQGLIIDLEGTLISNGNALPGSIELINHLIVKKIPFQIITNTVSRNSEQLSSTLYSLGINVDQERITNPIIALDHFMKKQNVETYYFVGPSYINLTANVASLTGIPEYVVLCDFEYINCNYELLNRIFNYLSQGSKLLSMSYSDYYFSKLEKRLDTGAFTKMFETITNNKAIILGKPSPLIYQTALKEIGVKSEETIAIGDDGLTDIVGGKNAGLETILIRSGKYKFGDEDIYKPDHTLNNLLEVVKLLRG